MEIINLYSKKACAYIRVSTDRQEELSPDAQKRLLLEYAKKNNIELDAQDIYMDLGISGTKAMKRPEFQNMIATAKDKEHPYDIILVWKFSRFARNQEESIVYKALLKKNNVDVISISEPLIDGPFGSLIERIIEWMDEYYSIRLSGEVKRGMKEKVLQHGYVQTAPYGYNHVSGQIPSIDETKAKVVIWIYEEFAIRKSSYSKITRTLNDQGTRTNNGNPFEPRTVKYILTNPFYIGKVRLNGQLYDAPHETLISEELFNTAAERVNSLKLKGTRKQPTDTCAHWLSGTIKCSNCGASLGYTRGKVNKWGKVYPTFNCWKAAKQQCNKNTSITSKRASEYVIEGLKQVLVADHIEYEVVTSDDSGEKKELLLARLQKLDQKEKRAKQAYLDEVDSLADYKETKMAINKERDAISKELDNLNNVMLQSSQGDMRQAIESVIDTLEHADITKEQKAEAIRSICSAIYYIREDDSMEFHFYFSA